MYVHSTHSAWPCLVLPPQLWQVPLDSGDYKKAIAVAEERQFSLSPDGRLLLFFPQIDTAIRRALLFNCNSINTNSSQQHTEEEEDEEARRCLFVHTCRLVWLPPTSCCWAMSLGRKRRGMWSCAALPTPHSNWWRATCSRRQEKSWKPNRTRFNWPIVSNHAGPAATAGRSTLKLVSASYSGATRSPRPVSFMKIPFFFPSPFNLSSPVVPWSVKIVNCHHPSLKM